ncbi:MAG: chloride channel protein [Anaerolineales bacterium]
MSTIKGFIPNVLDRIQPSVTAVLIGTAIIVGLGTGLGAVIFIRLIGLLQSFFFVGGSNVFGFLGRGLLILVPVVGGLLAGPIITFFAKEAKGHGVPEVMQAIALRGGVIRPRVVVAKIAASAICIGSGGSAGREGPIVQVGAALGSTLGQWLHLSEARIRNLVACGAAAGIAATFNAPIAGVVFAMEIILGELHIGYLGNVIISSVTASTLARVFLGERPAFEMPRYGMKTPWEIFLYAILGVLAALIAVLFIKLLYWFEDRFDSWRFPDALKPAVGGLLLGLLAFVYPLIMAQALIPASESTLGVPIYANLPHIFSAGFETIEQTLLGNLSFMLLFAMIFLKPLATSFTLGSGNSGGVFAPSLFTGAALGGAFGRLMEYLAPGATAGPGAFASVGMAAVFAGAARAPFTAILIVFEMTDDYRLIIPLMTGVIVSLLVAEKLHKESIYTLKLARRGIKLQSGVDVDVMESVKVEEVMVADPLALSGSLPISVLESEFIRTGRHGFPVLNEEGSLYGIVSLEDYRRVLTDDDVDVNQLPIKDISTRKLITVYPDESVGEAMRKMAPRDLSRLPVVTRENPQQLVGVIRRNDIVRAYEVGALRREEARRRSEISEAYADSPATFIEISIPQNSGVIGKKVSELELPKAAVLVSIRRGRSLVIPKGETSFQAGDNVTALCERDSVDLVKGVFNTPKEVETGTG